MFTYTESWTNLDSSLVKGVFYDADKYQMLVKLNGDKQYVYADVNRNEAATLASSGSVGRAYNSFRAFRPRGSAGSRAHGEIVAPKEEVDVTRTVGSGDFINASVYTLGSGTSGLSANYEVTFTVDGKTHNSTVQASSLSAAVADVSSKLNAFGTLRPVLTGVVRKP